MLTKIIRYVKDPLYKNSFFIMLSSITNATFGLFFWMIAARFYPAEDVGIATALWSSLSLIILFSRLGFDFSIIRFFPLREKSKVFSTSVIISTVFAIILGIVFVVGIDIFSPKLHLLKNPMYSAIFLITILLSSILTSIAYSFIALRRGEAYFYQNLIIGVRLIFILFLTSLGAVGIFGSISIATFFALIVAFLLIKRSINLSISLDLSYIKDSFKFSTGNYIANLFSVAPNHILPIIVLNLLGAEKAAYYYIAFSIAWLIFMIPNSIAMSLFVEGSRGVSLKKNVLKSLVATIGLLTPAILFIYFFGEFILYLFGKDYVQAFELLRLFALSSFFVAVVFIYLAIKRVQMDIRSIMFLNGLTCFLLLLSSYSLILMFDIVGVGYAWIVSYFVSAFFIIMYTVVIKKKV